jgi:hypothetical protein
MRPRHDAHPFTAAATTLRALRAVEAAVPRTPTSTSPSRIRWGIADEWGNINFGATSTYLGLSWQSILFWASFTQGLGSAWPNALRGQLPNFTLGNNKVEDLYAGVLLAEKWQSKQCPLPKQSH